MNKDVNTCKDCQSRSVWICFFECLFLAFFKLVIGLTCGSKAMLGSALYTVTDLISAFLLIVSLKVSRKPADAGHPYGHGKVEYLVSLCISVIVLVGTSALILASTFSLYKLDMSPLHWIGVWASLACLCLTEIVSRLMSCCAKHSKSPAMAAHVKHMNLDTISDIAVIVAIVADEAGFSMVDPLIALAEGIHILYECSAMIHRSVSQLMDRSIPRDVLEEVRAVISTNPEVKAIADLKGRHSGYGVALDIGIELDGSRTVGDARTIVAALEQSIQAAMPNVASVDIHYHSHHGAEAGLAL
jgi:cation diffusion facilitator family transporter